MLVALRDAVRRREIYVEGAARWRNPEDDLPGDFESTRTVHYAAIRQPEDPQEFVAGLKRRMTDGLDRLSAALADGSAGGVKVTTRKGEPWITVPKLEPLAEPTGLQALKDEVVRRWGVLDLLDVLKNADFLTGFTERVLLGRRLRAHRPRRPSSAACCWRCSRWARTWASARSWRPASTARARPRCGTCAGTSSPSTTCAPP